MGEVLGNDPRMFYRNHVNDTQNQQDPNTSTSPLPSPQPEENMQKKQKLNESHKKKRKKVLTMQKGEKNFTAPLQDFSISYSR